MPNVQEVNYNLPETGVAKVPPLCGAGSVR